MDHTSALICSTLGQAQDPDHHRAEADVRLTLLLLYPYSLASDKPSGVEGFPQREWKIWIVLLDQDKAEIPATIFSKVTYLLHESFGDRAKQGTWVFSFTFTTNPPAFTTPPFGIEEEGWGEFDMSITLTTIDKGGEHNILHDLNFQKSRYEADHTIVGCLSSRVRYSELTSVADVQKPQAGSPGCAAREWACSGG
jgi:transcription initiation factor IIF auxiliary subunit